MHTLPSTLAMISLMIGANVQAQSVQDFVGETADNVIATLGAPTYASPTQLWFVTPQSVDGGHPTPPRALGSARGGTFGGAAPDYAPLQISRDFCQLEFVVADGVITSTAQSGPGCPRFLHTLKRRQNQVTERK